MTPLFIFLGLTPQQAIASGKIGGMGTTLGSLQGLMSSKIHRWKVVLPLMIMAVVVGLAAPFAIKHLDNSLYRHLIGVILILLIPVILLKKVGIETKEPKAWQKALAVPLLFITLLMQAIFSSGMGTLVVLVLMGFLGMRALEANVTKRLSQVLLNTLLIIGLLGSGLIIWSVAAVIFFTNLAGSYIGSKVALKRGDLFVTRIFAVMMLVSGLALLLG